jgi:hypothetical protein
MGLELGQDRAKMPLAEDQHPVSDLRSCGEHEPFRITVRARAAGQGSGVFRICRFIWMRATG